MSSESGIQRVGIQNPVGQNPESSGSESRIQMVGIRNPEPLWILLHGSSHGNSQIVYEAVRAENVEHCEFNVPKSLQMHCFTLALAPNEFSKYFRGLNI